MALERGIFTAFLAAERGKKTADVIKLQLTRGIGAIDQLFWAEAWNRIDRRAVVLFWAMPQSFGMCVPERISSVRVFMVDKALGLFAS